MTQSVHSSVSAGEILLLDDGVRLRALERLMKQGSADAARVFSACTLTIIVDDVFDTDILSATYMGIDLLLACPSECATTLSDEQHPITVDVHRALMESLPANTFIRRFTILENGPGVTPSPEDLNITSVGADDASNQGMQIGLGPVLVWEHLRFRSKTEVRIAQALDRLGVLYFPNCRGRLGAGDARLTREPDFLVCSNGNWGILEVDGEPFHLDPDRDAARDALFRSAGVAVIEHYNARECYERPDEVVSSFLTRLKSKG